MLGNSGLCAGIGTVPKGLSWRTMSGGKLKSSLAVGKGFFALLRADLALDAEDDFF